MNMTLASILRVNFQIRHSKIKETTKDTKEHEAKLAANHREKTRIIPYNSCSFAKFAAKFFSS